MSDPFDLDTGDQAEADEPPLIAGKIHGVRTWSLASIESGLSAWNGEHWRAGGETTKAVCRYGHRHSNHDTPSAGCECGLYALHPHQIGRSGFWIWDWEVEDDVAAGVVEAWGRIEVHGEGFRAQYARPVALVAGSRMSSKRRRDLAGLARRYCADVIEAGSEPELVNECTARGWGLSPETVATLVPEEPEIVCAYPGPGWTPPPPVPPPAPPARAVPPTPAERWRKRLENAVVYTVGGIGILIQLAIYLAMGWGVVGAIFGWLPDSPPAPKPTPDQVAQRDLEVVRQGVVWDGKRDPLYVGVVRSAGRHVAVVGVTAQLNYFDANGLPDEPTSTETFGHPAVIPPGGTAVIVDRVRAAPSGARRYTSTLQARATRSSGPSPIRSLKVRLRSDPCRAVAAIDSRRPLRHLTVVGVASEGPTIGDVRTFHLGPVPPGYSNESLTGLAPNYCVRNPRTYTAYPKLKRRQLSQAPAG